MKRIIIVYFLLTGLYCFCSAQQVVSTGGYNVKSGISVDWMLGGSLSDISISEPDLLQKALEEEQSVTEKKFRVYPVPATDFINIETGIADTSKLAFEFFNDSGIMVLSRKLNNLQYQQISISEIPTGIYFLKISVPSSDKALFIKKIIKN